MAEAINKQFIRFEVEDNDKKYERQYKEQIGDDDSHLTLYPEIIPLSRVDAPETLTDSNCIFVSNSIGSDSYNGHEHLGGGSPITEGPYKTVDKAITMFFAQGSRVLKYICLSDNYIYVEDIQIPEWLDGYIYKDDLGSPSYSPTIRRIARTIPAGLTDNNTKWVDLVTPGSDVNLGTRLSPYLTIQKAFDDVVVEADSSPSVLFTYIAVRVDDTHYITTENISYMASSNCTQTVSLIPYMDQTGSETKAGKSLELKFNKLQDVKFNSYFTYSTLLNIYVSRYYNINNNEELFVNDYSLSTNNVYNKTSDFKTYNDNNASVLFKTNALGEIKGGSNRWYLLAIGNDGNTFHIYYESIGGIKGNFSLNSLIPTWNNMLFACFVVCDNFTLLLICGNDSSLIHHMKFYKMTKGIDPISISALEEIYSMDNTSTNNYNNMYKVENNKVMWSYYDNGINDGVYVYNGLIINKYDFSDRMYYFFEKENKIYSIINSNTNNHNITIVRLDFENNLLFNEKEIISEYTGIGSALDNAHIIISYYKNNIYMLLWYVNMTPSGKYHTLLRFDNKFNYIKIGETSIQLKIYHSKMSNHFFIYKNLFIVNKVVSQYNLGYFNISNISSFGKLDCQGINFNDNNEGICLIGDEISSKYCKFNENITGLQCKEDQLDDIENNIFLNCDYPIIIERYCEKEINFCLFQNYQIAIDYQPLSDASDEYIHVNYCTGNLGNTFLNISDRSVNIDKQSKINHSIISKTSVICKSLEEEDVDIAYSIIYPYSTYVGVDIDEDTCITAIPIFIDEVNYDFKLRSKKLLSASGNYYKYTSVGKDASNETDTPLGKDKDWSNYAVQNKDLGCYTEMTPTFSMKDWDSLEFGISMDKLTYSFRQDQSNISNTLQNKTYKILPIIKRLFNFKFDDSAIQGIGDPVRNIQLNIQKIVRLMEQIKAFKLFINPLYSQINTANYEILSYNSTADWQASQMYSIINNHRAGWNSGIWTLTDMVLDMNINIEKGLYNKLFVVIYSNDNGVLTKYSYKISDTSSAGLLTLEDYWGFGDLPNGTYACIIAYALVFHELGVLNNNIGKGSYGGLNYYDFNHIGGQDIKLIEAI